MPAWSARNSDASAIASSPRACNVSDLVSPTLAQMPHFSVAERNASGGVRRGSAAYQMWAESRGLAPFNAHREDGTQSYAGLSVDERRETRHGAHACNYYELLPTLEQKNHSSSSIILFDLTTENNLFDLFTNERTHCCLQIAQDYPHATLMLHSSRGPLTVAQKWLLFVLSRTCGVQAFDGPALTSACVHVVQTGRFGGDHSMARPDAFEQNLEYASAPILRSMRLRMHASLDVPPLHDNEPHVLLIVRATRTLVDADSGTSAALVAALCQAVPLRVLSFMDLSPEEQVVALSQAAVVIGVHGSELTNVAWMQPGSVVIEVTLRYGWCCDPVPAESIGYEAPQSSHCSTSFYECPNGQMEAGNPCRAYHKADICNLAHALGLTWTYFDPAYVSPPTTENSVSRDTVHVESRTLAASATEALRAAQTNRNHHGRR